LKPKYLLASLTVYSNWSLYNQYHENKEILSVLEEMAPLAYAEAFDNVGLLLGDQNEEATGVLVCHDALENVINEAITKM
jgi:putative NIF3 family GTP cyclohydrolase 1 type 2